jgi:hypothetical protein
MDEELSEDEKKALKELAQNFMAMSRVGRIFKTGLLWLSGILVASWIVWDKFLTHIINK